MAQLVARSFQTPEICRDLNAVITKLYSPTTVLYWNDKIEEKEAGNGTFLKETSLILLLAPGNADRAFLRKAHGTVVWVHLKCIGSSSARVEPKNDRFMDHHSFPLQDSNPREDGSGLHMRLIACGLQVSNETFEQNFFDLFQFIFDRLLYYSAKRKHRWSPEKWRRGSSPSTVSLSFPDSVTRLGDFWD